MRYSYDFIVPKSTTAHIPFKVDLRLDYGILTQVILRFRAGCHNRVFFILRDGLFQIVPAAGGQALYADDQTIFIPMHYPMISSPYELHVRSWSPGTIYDHTLSLFLDLQEQTEPVHPGLLDQLKHLLGLT